MEWGQKSEKKKVLKISSNDLDASKTIQAFVT